MTRQRLGILLDKYNQGHCTDDELQELERYYASLDRPDSKGLPDWITNKWEQFASQEYERLRAALPQNKKLHRGIWRQPYKVAASLVGLLGLALLSLYIYKNSFSHVKQPPAVVHYEVTNSQVADSRYLHLPDSSVVILHAGSQLQVDTTGFNKEGRHVTLTGEAYFDIAHNPARPFVIKVNNLTVTVLGTAFNIKQVGDSVAVTVTRGKVQVARNDKNLAVLTAGKQLLTKAGAALTESTEVEIAPVINWMSTGLHFNNMALGEAVQQLSQRYNTNILIKTMGLEHCRINVETSFKGTESLNVILDVICAVLGAHYTNTNGTIEIMGQPCDS
jgi:ferric-dicitrate binding protein FerR (iron transport regulator)